MVTDDNQISVSKEHAFKPINACKGEVKFSTAVPRGLLLNGQDAY